jgi:hypothetical protein
MVAFKIVMSSKEDAAAGYLLPLEPPLGVYKMVGSGEAAPFGPVTAVEHGFSQRGLDGKELWYEAIGVFSGANGDAVFFTYRGVSQTPEATLVITGGKGRFLGARGTGIMTAVPGAAAGDWTCTFSGTISAPKP